MVVVHLMSTRIKNVLVMVVALFLLGASSQAAVCELACGVQMQAAECHAGAASSAPMHGAMSDMEHGTVAGHAAGMVMDRSHCAHAMGMAPMQAVIHSLGECHDGSCSHAAVVAFDKGGPGAVSFAAVQWVAVAVVPARWRWPASYLGGGKRPLARSAAADPLVVSLRV
jgi:hypothetical protein